MKGDRENDAGSLKRYTSTAFAVTLKYFRKLACLGLVNPRAYQ